MKKILKIGLVGLIFAAFFTGCASTGQSGKSGKSIKSENLIYKGIAFEDWRDRFFGQELPEWFLYAYEQDFSGVIACREDFSGLLPEQIYAISGAALNGDQAEQFIAQKVQEIAAGGTETVLDTFWAKLSDDDDTGGDDANVASVKSGESKKSYTWLILVKKETTGE